MCTWRRTVNVLEKEREDMGPTRQWLHKGIPEGFIFAVTCWLLHLVKVFWGHGNMGIQGGTEVPS